MTCRPGSRTGPWFIQLTSDGQLCDHVSMTSIHVDDLEWQKLRSVAGLAESVLPVAVQDVDGDVLMVAYVSEEAVRESVRTRRAVFFSTSKGHLHYKGSTSGDHLELVAIRVNCERNSLLFIVRRLGDGACHVRDESGTAFGTCFHRVVHTS
jgi:phosphoribosyl-AMP cyclohydrolase